MDGQEFRVARIGKSPAQAMRTGFSLLELLVSVAVLGILLVLMGQIVDGVLASTRVQNAQMDSVASARRALDLLEADLRSAVIGQTASVLVPSSADTPVSLVMVTARRGPDTATGHRFLAVAYATNSSNELVRTHRSVPGTETNLLASPAAIATPDGMSTLGGGILAWQVRAPAPDGPIPVGELLSHGMAVTNYNGLPVADGWATLLPQGDFVRPDGAAVDTLELWIAAVGPESLALLSASGAKPALLTALSGDPADWREAVDAAPGVPPPLKSAVRILKKVVALR